MQADNGTHLPNDRKLILVIDDDPIFRGAVVSFLQRQQFETLEAADAQSALDLAVAHNPDAAIVDIVLPAYPRARPQQDHNQGIELARQLKRHDPTLGIVLFSAFGDRSDVVLQLAVEGMRGLAYLMKGYRSGTGVLLQALEETQAGHIMIRSDEPGAAQALAEKFWARLSPQEAPYVRRAIELFPTLTAREQEVAFTLAQAQTVQSTAGTLNITEGNGRKAHQPHLQQTRTGAGRHGRPGSAQGDPPGQGLLADRHARRAQQHLMPTWLRNSAGAALIISLLLGGIAIISVASSIGQAFGGYTTALLSQSTRTIVAADTPIWWPIYQTSLSPNSSIDLISVNGRSHRTDAPNVFEEAAIAGDESAKVGIRILDTGETFDIDVPVIRFSFIDFLELKLPDLIVGLCFWLAAAVVLKARPTEPLNQRFAIVAALIAAHRWMAINAVWMDVRLLPTLLAATHLVVAGLIGPALIHFALLFPTAVQPWPRRLLALAYVGGLSTGLILAAARIWAPYNPGTVDEIPFIATSYNLMLAIYLTGVLILFARLLSALFAGRHSRRERRVRLIVLLSLVVALPMLLSLAAGVVPGMGEDQVYFLYGLDLRYLLLAVPLALALVIVRYQSMRSPSRLLILVIALAGSALLAALISWLWGLAQGDWPASGEHPPFPYLFAGIFLASVFWSTQTTWRGWFGRLLDWDTHSYNATRAFGRQVSGTTNLGDLSQTMATALVSELQLDRAAVWIWKPEAGAFELVAAAGQPDPPLPDCLPRPADGLPQANRPLRLDIAETVPPWLEPLSGLQVIDVVVPLQADGQPIGLLGLGHRWDEEIFDDRDLVIAELVGQQAALFLLAALQVEELRRVPQRVVEAQEGERRRLAAELHDTVQQFLGGLPFALSFTVAQIEADPDGVADALEGCLGETERMAETVRRIRFNLAPSRLNHSLAQSLGDLAVYVERRTGLPVVLATCDELDAATTLMTREALYRVVQQALDNVVAHAAASEAHVRLECDDSRVTLAVIDNGRGCSEAARQAAAAQQRFGLFSMRARLELCGGAFAFQSAEGKDHGIGLGSGTEPDRIEVFLHWRWRKTGFISSGVESTMILSRTRARLWGGAGCGR